MWKLTKFRLGHFQWLCNKLPEGRWTNLRWWKSGRPFHGLFFYGGWEMVGNGVLLSCQLFQWTDGHEPGIFHPKSSACRDLPAAAQRPEGWNRSQLNLPICKKLTGSSWWDNQWQNHQNQPCNRQNPLSKTWCRPFRSQQPTGNPGLPARPGGWPNLASTWPRPGETLARHWPQQPAMGGCGIRGGVPSRFCLGLPLFG